MKFRRSFFLLLLLLGIADHVSAETLSVPGDFPTIQAAIDAAAHGDLILVDPGTYPEKLDFLGKAITVKSTDGSSVTLIDAGQSGSVVTLQSGEGRDSVLDGFTLTGGTGTILPDDPYPAGGGVLVIGSRISRRAACNL